MKFDRPFFSFGGHLETLWPKDQPHFQATLWTEKTLSVDSENEIKIRFTSFKTKILVILHGLGSDWGTSESMWSAQGAYEAGWSVVQVRWARNPPSHAGQKEHLETVLQFLETQRKFQRIYILGFSMGASIMLNWARKQNLKRVQKLIAVCGPLDLDSASRRLKTGFSRLYDFRFNRILRGWYPRAKLKPFMTIYDVDEFFTSKAHGFKDRNDYYTSCSPLYFLDEIQIPQHYIVAENDPLIDVKEYKKLKPSPLRLITITEGGGHVGYGNWMKSLITNILK
jgi:uncharacterized protein